MSSLLAMRIVNMAILTMHKGCHVATAGVSNIEKKTITGVGVGLSVLRRARRVLYIVKKEITR